MVKRLTVFLMTLLLPAVALGQAEDPVTKAQAIMDEMEARGDGFQGSSSDGRMLLIDASGQSSERRFTSKVLEGVGEEGARGLLIFSYPKDIDKTALLTISNQDGEDDQWFYLPALKRVKRISSSGQTGAFVGSEFTFEDLRTADKDDYHQVWLQDLPCPTMPELLCSLIERQPLNKESGYSKIHVYIDLTEYRIVQSNYFDRSGRHFKTLTASDFVLYKERFWRANRVVMVNLVNGKSTEMLWEGHDFETPLSAEDFTTRALERLQ